MVDVTQEMWEPVLLTQSMTSEEPKQLCKSFPLLSPHPLFPQHWDRVTSNGYIKKN